MRNNCRYHSVLIETLCCRRAANSATVSEASVFGYDHLSSGRTSRKEFPHPDRKALNILAIEFRSSRCFTFSSSSPALAVG
jgi:hypothetical protein